MDMDGYDVYAVMNVGFLGMIGGLSALKCHVVRICAM